MNSAAHGKMNGKTFVVIVAFFGGVAWLATQEYRRSITTHRRRVAPAGSRLQAEVAQNVMLA